MRSPAPIGPPAGDVFTHDPSLVRTREGTYFAYATHNLIEVRSSPDRRTFRSEGSAFSKPLSWTSAYPTSTDLWAPDVSFHNGRFWMYYSVSGFGVNTSAIGLATSPSGAAGTWTDKGKVYASSAASDYNAIDPGLTVDATGRWWLVFGSFWSGIKLIELDPRTGKQLAGNTRRYDLARRPGTEDAIEAPYIRASGGWFYQFVSFDRCCRGAASTYRVMVGRAKQITGPYLDKAGRPMLRGGGSQLLGASKGVHGPGGQSVLADIDGDVLVYHYYNDDGAPVLGLARLTYAAGWPVVRA